MNSKVLRRVFYYQRIKQTTESQWMFNTGLRQTGGFIPVCETDLLIKSTKVSWGLNWGHSCYMSHRFGCLSCVSQSITVSYLLQLPVELGRSEGVHLGEVSPQQEHQAAIMDIQRVVMTVHLCGREEKESAKGTNSSHLHVALWNQTKLGQQHCFGGDQLSKCHFTWCSYWNFSNKIMPLDKACYDATELQTLLSVTVFEQTSSPNAL